MQTPRVLEQGHAVSHSKRSFLMLLGLDKDRTTDQVHQATMHPVLPFMSKAASAPTSHKAISQPSSDGSVHPGLGTSRKLHKGADPHVIPLSACIYGCMGPVMITQQGRFSNGPFQGIAMR